MSKNQKKNHEGFQFSQIFQLFKILKFSYVTLYPCKNIQFEHTHAVVQQREIQISRADYRAAKQHPNSVQE